VASPYEKFILKNLNRKNSRLRRVSTYAYMLMDNARNTTICRALQTYVYVLE
jgi:hypothetical protein